MKIGDYDVKVATTANNWRVRFDKQNMSSKWPCNTSGEGMQLPAQINRSSLNVPD